MKRTALPAIIIVSLVAAGGYFLYRTFAPGIIADALVSESLPAYIPKRFHARVESIKRPLNKGAEAMLEKMHESRIPLDRVLQAIDDVSEEEAYAFLDDLNKAKPSDTDEVFDIAKTHFHTDFDPEVFREPFNRYFDIRQIRNGIAHANLNRRSNDVDITIGKAILKKIIIEKEKEVITKKQ